MDQQTLVAPVLTAVLGAALFMFFFKRQKSADSTANSKDQPPKADGDSTAVVTHIYVYPIKSAKGTALETAQIGEFGILHDREWMVVNKDGRFQTQRTVPHMALLEPRLFSDRLELHYPGQEPFSLPLKEDPNNYEIIVTVWGFTGPAWDQGDRVANFLSKALERDGLRLVRIQRDHRREVDREHLSKDDNASHRTAFADGFPFLLISQESLDDLNERLLESKSADKALPMRRFRPNFVVKGAGVPFAEDTWRHLNLGSIPFEAVKKCSRCKMTTVDPERGEYDGAEPLKLLGTFRRDPPHEGSDKAVYFGQNLVCHARGGSVSVGDSLCLRYQT